MPKPQLDGFSRLVHAKDTTRNAALLRAMTELYALDPDHDAGQNRRFEELATHLLPDAGLDDRIFVAERLADISDAPLTVLGALARDDIEVARPILARSMTLGAFELLTALAAGGAEHARIIAGRPDLPADVKAALAHRDVTGPAADDGSDSPPTAQTDDRREAAAGHSASAAAFLEMETDERLRYIARMADARLSGGRSGPGGADEAFEQLIGSAQIVGFARSRQRAEFVASVARGLDLPKNLVEASLEDLTGEPLALVMKALRIDDVTAQQVFLGMSPVGLDVQAFFQLSDLYSGLEAVVAAGIIERWREDVRTPAPRHEQAAPEIPSRRTERARTYRPIARRPFGRAKRA